MGADIDHRHPEASNDILNWGTWIVKELGDGVAGFRFDAVKVCTPFGLKLHASTDQQLMLCSILIEISLQNLFNTFERTPGKAASLRLASTGRTRSPT